MSSKITPHLDHNGFVSGEAVFVLDTLTWSIRRGEIVASRLGVYLVRLMDGREQYFPPMQIKRLGETPAPRLF